MSFFEGKVLGKGNQPRRWLHSEEYESPVSIFKGYEVAVTSISDLWNSMKKIQDVHDSRLLWRGQSNHEWGLHSSLFRVLRDQKYGGRFSAEVHDQLRDQKIDLKDRYPSENDLQDAESEILRQSRTGWRLDSLSAMEIFARIQHRGGPTRLIDFSFNPLIALWFAVSDSSQDEIDARLFCLALKGPVANSEQADVRLDSDWGGYEPKWHQWESDDDRRANDWGTGSLRRFWVPPIYDSRMLAQNSVFVIDGVPISGKQIQSSFHIMGAPQNRNWKMADLLSAGSLYLKFYEPGVENKTTSRNFASTYTLRIPAKEKPGLRAQLETWFGYDAAAIYPDVDGLRQNLAQLFLT
ncbi:FRG domain-containing protein [Glutamicibacter halophytocola]|uniref:FRG domain-containing protein n=1 Tax=Glutamicibacter halophytocola TaxID=1933880 RepID=A0ABX5Y4K6_9MICC|nr:FRG domain-containing protein [Glutamicibacter halophytocola]QDY65058.1 FRG domain-containing protein [Glutamicibacter halophytocola]